MNLSEFEQYLKSLVQRTEFTPTNVKTKCKNISMSDIGSEPTELPDESLSAAAGGIYEKGDDKRDDK